MYANKQNILELAALMLKFEVDHVVVCPGSRNAPLSQTFAANKKFKCYSVTDERSAAFFALGLIQALKKPVAICCTSGSALLNVLPAVSEAYYQQLPLLVISADRPQEWIGQMDGQTIPQPNIANPIFKKSVHLPEVKDESELWYCNRQINEALLSLTHLTNGPVHINVPLSEPLFDFSVSELPEVRKISRYTTANPQFILSEQLLEQWNKAERPLIIAGQQSYSPEISKAIEELSETKNCVVLAEQISNLYNSRAVVSNFDPILHAYPEDDNLRPDLVVYFGGHIVSKRLKAFIRSNKPENLWLITPDGEVVDTFKCLTTIVEAHTLPVLQSLSETKNTFSEDYKTAWTKRSKEISERSEKYSFTAFSDLYVMKGVIQHLPNCCLQLANSSIIRNTQLFSLKNAHAVFCNRGTNGIEGSMSTAVGFSNKNESLTYLFIGDLSFFFDMNALWNQHLSRKLRILVINNGNGQIFNTLPNLVKSEIRTKFIAAAHDSSVKVWVEDRGFIYLTANNQEDLKNVLAIFCDPEYKRPLVLEVFTNAEVSEQDIKDYYKHLKI